ncbi:hypothetical protein N7522_001068 [Penicillium canescens]|nr:hypothetical protein N7522_001068 [Penicillium canescens]
MEETIAELRRQLEEERRAREEADGDSNPTPYSASSIAAMTLCLKRSESRRMRPSRLRAMRPTR